MSVQGTWGEIRIVGIWKQRWCMGHLCGDKQMWESLSTSYSTRRMTPENSHSGCNESVTFSFKGYSRLAWDGCYHSCTRLARLSSSCAGDKLRRITRPLQNESSVLLHSHASVLGMVSMSLIKGPPWSAALFLHKYTFLTQGSLKNNTLWHVFGQYVIAITYFSSSASITLAPLFEKCIVNLLFNWKEEKLIKRNFTQSSLTHKQLVNYIFHF